MQPDYGCRAGLDPAFTNPGGSSVRTRSGSSHPGCPVAADDGGDDLIVGGGGFTGLDGGDCGATGQFHRLAHLEPQPLCRAAHVVVGDQDDFVDQVADDVDVDFGAAPGRQCVGTGVDGVEGNRFAGGDTVLNSPLIKWLFSALTPR